MKRSNEVVGWSIGVAAAALLMLSSLSFSAPPSAKDGEATYKAKCAMCHGPDGSGDTAMGKRMKIKDLRSEEVQKQSDAQFEEIIAKGKSPMQGYEKSLDAAKIKDVVAFIRELAKKK